MYYLYETKRKMFVINLINKKNYNDTLHLIYFNFVIIIFEYS